MISQNDTYHIINVGSKQLSSDGGAHGNNNMQGYGLVYPLVDYPKESQELLIEKLSEEHAFVKRNPKVSINLGDKVRIIPNHSCVVMNLASKWYLINGKKVKKKLKKYS